MREADLSESFHNPERFAKITTELAWKWPNIDPWQRAVLTDKERFIILNCSRQSGKSSTLAVKGVHTAISEPDSLILVVAEQRQSNEDLRKCREITHAYQKFLREGTQGKITLPLIAESVTQIEYDNGSRIIALPGNEKVRGYSAPRMVIIDEGAFLEDEVFIGLDPMMEVSKGQMILASTPNGTSGFFHTEWGNQRYKHYRIPWQQCPRISPESIAQKRQLYGEAYVKQEYECVFLDEIASLFTDQALRESIDDTEDVLADQIARMQQMEARDELLV